MTALVPPEFAALTTRRDGLRGALWIRALPDLVDDLLQRWGGERDGSVLHGQVGLVVPVVTPQGGAVLKVSPPNPLNRGEAVVLSHLAGRSAVRLYRSDPDRCALLLERADGPRPAEILSPDESVEMMGHLAAALAVPFPEGPVTLASTAAGWLEEIEKRTRVLPGLVTPAALQRARAAVDLVALDRSATVLHGDLHEGNVLGSTRGPWLAIDPKGWIGTAAYDGFTVALARYDRLVEEADPVAVIRGRLRRFASSAGLDPDLVTEIAHARAVSFLLYEATHSDDPLARRLLSAVVNDA